MNSFLTSYVVIIHSEEEEETQLKPKNVTFQWALSRFMYAMLFFQSCKHQQPNS
jgi:hypothetical protein